MHSFAVKIYFFAKTLNPNSDCLYLKVYCDMKICVSKIYSTNIHKVLCYFGDKANI